MTTEMPKSQENLVAKVVPDRIFSLAVHPTESKHFIAAGGKWGAVGLWDIDDQSSDTHGVHAFMVSLSTGASSQRVC